MFDWFSEASNFILGGLPKLAWKSVPESKKRQILARIREINRYKVVAHNHDLTRALRLAWIEATEQILNEAERLSEVAEYRESSKEFATFAGVLRKRLREIRNEALDRESKNALPASIIDRHVNDIMRGVPQSLISNEATAFSRNVDRQFVDMVAEIAHWPAQEIPYLIASLARGDGHNREFGQLVFDAFTKILKDPKEYPEAREAFRIVQQESTAALSRQTLELLNELDDTFRQLLSPEFFQSVATMSDNVAEVVQILRGMKAAGAEAAEGTFVAGSKFPEAEPGTIFVLSEEARRDHVELIGNELRRLADRLAPEAEFSPYFWRLDEAERLLVLEPRLLDQLIAPWRSGVTMSMILLISNDLGRPLDVTENAENLIRAAGLVGEQGRPGIMTKWPATQFEQRALIEAGHLPVTLRTLALATLIVSGRPLWVCFEGEIGEGLVKNFRTLAQNQRAFISRTTSPADLTWLDGFARRTFTPEGSVAENPYRYLEFYDVDDARNFFGRDAEAESLRQLLIGNSDGRPPSCVAITGPSGSGKSSFLRAQVMASLAGQGTPCVIVRPTTFHSAGGQAHNTLMLLLEQIAEQTDLALDPGLIATIARLPSADSVRPALNAVRAALRRLNLKGRELTIAIDQFEELLDDLADDRNVAEWRALIEFVEQLIATGGVRLYYTLEDSRIDLLPKVLPDSPIPAAPRIALGSVTDNFLKEIITRPFLGTGFVLAQEIVSQLINEVRNTERPGRGGSSGITGSVLPLLALKLSLLHDRVAALRSPFHPKSSLGTAFGHSADVAIEIEMEDLAGYDLTLESEIEALAEHAWKAAADDKDDIEEFDQFLRPFARISIGGPSGDSDQATIVLRNFSVPANGTRANLYETFRRDRLLIPSASGLRLVHEAVIRRWQRAREWFHAYEDGLRFEAQMRLEAQVWNLKGRKPTAAADDDAIDMAATVLRGNIVEWLSEEGPAQNDLLLQAYCFDQFSHSRTPRRLINHSSDGRMHVHIAAEYSLVALLERFKQLDPESLHERTQKYKRTPLYLAAFRALDSVRFLLNSGADRSAASTYGFTPLDVAVWRGTAEIVEAILQGLNVADYRSKIIKNPIVGAAAKGDLALSIALEKAGFDPCLPSDDGTTPLSIAAQNGYPEAVRHFCNICDPCTKVYGRTILHLAALHGRDEVIRTIIANEKSFQLVEQRDDWSQTPLMDAASNSQPKAVQALVHFSDPTAMVPPGFDKAGFTALHFAVEPLAENDFLSSHRVSAVHKTVEILLGEPGVNVMARSENGKAPYTMGASVPAIARLMRSHPSFSLSAVPAGDWSALMDSLKGDAKELRRIVRLLEQGEFDPWGGKLDPWSGEADESGPFPAAIHAGHHDLARAMLRAARGKVHAHDLVNGLDAVLQRDAAEDLAAAIISHSPEAVIHMLPYAAMCGRADIYALLLAAGANPESRDEWSRRPIDFAPDGMIDVFESLERAHNCSTLANGNAGSAANAGHETGRIAVARQLALFHRDAAGWLPLSDEERHLYIGDSKSTDSAAWKRDLPFYPGAKLILIEPKTWLESARSTYYLVKGDGILRLDGTSPPLHQFNFDGNLSLDDSNVLDYIAFFCFFVRGDDGAFLMLDRADHPALPKRIFGPRPNGAYAPARRLQRIFHTPRYFGREEDGRWRLSSLIYYADAIFQSDFLVHGNGMCEMKDDYPIIQDIGAGADVDSIQEKRLFAATPPREWRTEVANKALDSSIAGAENKASDDADTPAKEEAFAPRGNPAHDIITDFKAEEGDVVDLCALFAGMGFSDEAIVEHYLRADSREDGVMLQVRTEMEGEWHDAVFLKGVLYFDVRGMLRSGNLDLS